MEEQKTVQMYLFYILVFITGLVIGSFLNVCIYRIPLKESIVFPASHCVNCKHQLAVLDLIPVFSFIFLKGKCRYCGTRISIQYPVIELVNALLFLCIFIHFGFSYQSFFFALFSSLLLVISVIDFNEGIIPNPLIIFGLILGLIYIVFTTIGTQSWDIIRDGLTGSLLGAFIIILIILISRGGMGAGDYKLMAVIGLFLGYKKIILVFFFAVIIGGIFAAFLLMFKSKERKSAIPFGPFISTAALIALFYGDLIIEWYLSSFVFF